MATIVYEDHVLIPDGVDDFASFRQWTHQDDFPESGRIDYVNGRIEIDMSPEQLFAHGRLKTEIVGTLVQLVDRSEWLVVSDSTRIASVEAGLSAEPDIVLLARDSIRSQRVRLTPKANRANDYIEIEGAANLVVEIVSDSSVGKDTKRLPTAYFSAGIGEYWIADARLDELSFIIYRRGSTSFERVETSDDGWQHSETLNRSLRLTRPVVEPDWVEFDLQVR